MSRKAAEKHKKEKKKKSKKGKKSKKVAEERVEEREIEPQHKVEIFDYEMPEVSILITCFVILLWKQNWNIWLYIALGFYLF